ncbi:MAG: hypothetical protein P8K08_01530, partial [Fuerstiella sp.]|nr:hypothetical protein [Fuerstiella sp.]
MFTPNGGMNGGIGSRTWKVVVIAKRKTPALYPKPAPVKISEPLKAVDVKTRRKKIVKATVEGPPPPEV